FGAGTVQWSWGLDSQHDRGTSSPDASMQQATVNLFADMGARPATLQPGADPVNHKVTEAAGSIDTVPPTSTISFPIAGSTVQSGIRVTITGTASDSGGVVAAVEVSVDGGGTWHQAQGNSPWSYQWVPGALGSVNIRSRAIDDSGRIETASAGVTVTVGPG